jgi:competence protein ComGC
MNLTTQIIAYEDGELTHEETVALFQELVSTGMIDHLQGSYHRMAMILIESGEIAPF